MRAVSSRPPLECRQGSFFRWAAPAGWRANETPNGVDINSPDGVTAAGSQLLRGAPGYATPNDFVLQALQYQPEYANMRILVARALPDQPAGAWRSAWKIAEMELGGTFKGVPIRSTWTCGISGMLGISFDALLQGYQAPFDRFDDDRLWLCRIACSIAITNFRGIAGNDQLIQPRNHPLDNSALIESWRQKGLSEDRISKARHEAMMGYERVKDPETGRIYEMPLEAWDGTIGGYRNPVRPTEILQKTEPGE